MVKVLENRVVDLDLLPGTKEQQEAAARAKLAANEANPAQHSHNATAGENAQNAGIAAVGALGGTVKGLVDTTGNTVGTLGEGLAGTLTGLGKGLGGAAVYGGSALDSAGRGFGRGLGFGGTAEKDTETVNNGTEDMNQVNTADLRQELATETDERTSGQTNSQGAEEFEQRKPIKMHDHDG